VTRPDDIRPALERALGSGTVAVVNVMTDPKGGRRGSMYLG
jgi:thiamine pyrophosphate-dependent acetolactate synthase large subunit-like protein